MESTSRKNFFAHLLQLAAALSILGTSLVLPAFADDLLYLVTVHPSGLSGTNGFMDMQFNPGAIPGTQSAFAGISEPLTWLQGIPGTGTTTGGAFYIPSERTVQWEIQRLSMITFSLWSSVRLLIPFTWASVALRWNRRTAPLSQAAASV